MFSGWIVKSARITQDCTHSAPVLIHLASSPLRISVTVRGRGIDSHACGPQCMMNLSQFVMSVQFI